MENMEVVMNEVEVMETAAEAVEVPAENSGKGLKVALAVGAVVLGGYLLYKKVIKPAIDRKKINADESKDAQVYNKPAGMRATTTVDSVPTGK